MIINVYIYIYTYMYTVIMMVHANELKAKAAPRFEAREVSNALWSFTILGPGVVAGPGLGLGV